MSNSLTGTQLGNYIIGDQIGEGGMGLVFRAFKPGSRDAFVVKVLLPAFRADPQFRRRFEREVALLETLQHPHIIPVLDYGEEGDLMYFVMPFIPGMSLADLEKKQRFSPATAWLILDPIAQALHYAHEQHIIHRDLKPDNILLRLGGSANPQVTYPYLADFGLSKPQDLSALTQAGISIGTPQYMSPEQVRALPVTPRTDVYALGIVAYEMLLGRVPFNNPNPDLTAMKHIRELPPEPRMLNRNFPQALEAVLLVALAKEPAARFESTEDFRASYWEAMQSIPLAAKMRDYWVS